MQALEALPNLRTLNLHSNLIEDFREIFKLRLLGSLHTVTLHGNPIEQLQHYRVFAVAALPHTVRNLDFSLVSMQVRSPLRRAYPCPKRSENGPPRGFDDPPHSKMRECIATLWRHHRTLCVRALSRGGSSPARTALLGLDGVACVYLASASPGARLREHMGQYPWPAREPRRHAPVRIPVTPPSLHFAAASPGARLACAYALCAFEIRQIGAGDAATPDEGGTTTEP